MPPRLKKLIGAFALIIGVPAYALAAMYVGAEWTPAHWLAQLAYFIVAGLAWAAPTALLVKWMNAPARR